ncbi:cation:proton antiporter [Kiloniella antarctica]|uniref:Cation:proton antiporter n=1 Tax=Kiloniella antarctica TaxID=1550907 RepID=A0ABW5BKH5_9PROT
MHLDPALSSFVAIILLLTGVGMAAHLFRQPVVVGYLLAGMILGPDGLAIVTDSDVLGRLGSIGVVLLLFFVGMEVSPKRLIANWRIAVMGTVLQIGLSVAIAFGLGEVLGWSFGRSLLIGFVLSLSSTAVILKLFQDWKEQDTNTGQDVLGILLVQDLAVIPMLIVIGAFSNTGFHTGQVVLQLVGGAGLLGIAIAVSVFAPIKLPFSKFWRQDHEMQVLIALTICFGLALISGLLQLSTALGAFVAGMVLHATHDTDWVEHSLLGFRTVFLAAFFLSIGMLVDFDFLAENWPLVCLLVGISLIANSGINTGILKLFGRSWRESIYGGAVLAQIGEFSFVLAAVGLQVALINETGYQIIISVITLSLLVSPVWIGGTKHLLKKYGDKNDVPA